MLKLYRPHAEQLLLAASYMRSRPVVLDDVLTSLRNHVCGNPRDQNIWNQAKKMSRVRLGANHWLDDVIKQLYRSLGDDYNGHGETDLIDQIVQACQLPYGRNVLSGDAMARLRQAILLPSERAGLLQRLRQREMACGLCGIGLHDHESVTLTTSPDGTQVFACHRCVPPTSVPCISCSATAALSTKAMNAMSRMQCPICQENKAEKRPPQQENNQPQPLDDPQAVPRAWSSRNAIGGRATVGSAGRPVFVPPAAITPTNATPTWLTEGASPFAPQAAPEGATGG